MPLDASTCYKSEGAGLFSMDIKTGIVYADKAVAETFGFPEAEAMSGISNKEFYERIALEFRNYVTELIAHSVESGEQIQVSYSIVRPDGSPIKALGFGQCFRSPTGEPLHYAGIVVPLSDCREKAASEVISHLLAAHECAVRLGSHEGAKGIVGAITTILTEEGVLSVQD